MTVQRVAFGVVFGLAGVLPAASLAADDSAAPIPEVTIDSKRFDAARDQIQPSLGATSYDFDRTSIEDAPQGDNSSFNHLILQAPGVTQDSYGQLHIRGEHANTQFRINGVQLPEGISVFGQVLQTRLADSVSLITGSLPAQYGLRTSAVIDIKTRSGSLDPGGEVSIYGGSHDTITPSAAYGGSVGNFDYFVTGDYQQNDLGIENPTGAANAIHDHTDQGKGFAYLTDRLDAETRISLIAASVRSQFQIPNNPSQTPSFTANGISNFPSELIDENQREITDFGILTLQKAQDDLNYQVSVFSRYSSVLFRPDPLADLLFTGIAQDASRKITSSGAQGDLSYKLNDTHTLRTGFIYQIERTTSNTTSTVLPTDPATGVQSSDTPISIVGNAARTGMVGGVYVQDEWHPFEHFTLNYGLRFDAVDEFTHENQLSPRVNVVYQLSDATTLHAGYSRYFTPPSFELVSGGQLAPFANTTGAPPNFQNNTPKAERADYWDIGISQTILPNLKVTLDGYYKDAHNLIDEGQFGSPILLTVFNYAEARQYGAEFGSNYAIGPLALYANVAYSSAQGKDITSSQFNFDTGDLSYIQNNFIHLDHEQQFSASGGATYHIASTKTDLSLDFIYGTGLRRDGEVPNGDSLPPYTQVNVGAAQQIPNDLIELEGRFDVVNLFDEPYELRDGSGVGVGAPQWGPRRAFYAGMTARF